MYIFMVGQTIKIYLIGRHELTTEQLKGFYSRTYSNPEFIELPQVTEWDINQIVQDIRSGIVVKIVGVIPSNIMVQIANKLGKPTTFYTITVNKELYQRLTGQVFDSKANKLDELLPKYPDLISIKEVTIMPYSFTTENIEELRKFKNVRFPKMLNVLYQALIQYLNLENSENSDVCLSIPEGDCKAALFMNVKDRNKKYNGVNEVIQGIKNKEFLYIVVFYE